MRQIVLLLATALVVLVPVQAADAKVRKGPSGNAFYTPPKPLPGKKHGDLIWARKVNASAALKGASENWLVLYRSTLAGGKPTAVSGIVSLPKGKAPKSGWKTISWEHGTTGIADVCAPSRDFGLNSPAVLSSWLKKGYAIVGTDYQGLGTPGTHRYLSGVDEGRSSLDILRAARQLDPRVGKNFALAGHSQGGHAALWAADLAPKWTPDLTLRGTVAFAPGSHLSEQAELVPALKSPNSGLGGIIALTTVGLNALRPDLHVLDLLSDPARALVPEVEKKCLGDVGKDWDTLAPAAMYKNGLPASAIKALDENDPENLTIKDAPIDVEQGDADTTVQPTFSDQLVTDLQGRGADVTYTKYPGVTHGTVVTGTSADHATAFIVKRLGKP